MGVYGKPLTFRVNGKVNLAKSTDVSACVNSKVNIGKTDISEDVSSKVHLSKTAISECVNGEDLSESTDIDSICVGFVCFGIVILILIEWALLGNWLSTLLGEETGRNLATLIVGIFIALVLILLIVVAIKAAWDNFDAGDGSF